MAKKKAAILGVSSILLVAMVVAVAVTATRKTATSSNDSSTGSSSEISTSAKAVKQICQPTDYKETCEETLSEAAGNTTDPQKLVQVAFNVTITHIREAIKNSSLLHKLATDPRAQDALENCHELLDFSINDLKKSFETVGSFNVTKMDEYMSDLKTWLSASITYQQTCLDGFENTTGDSGEEMKKLLQLSGELTSNGLAIVTELSQVLSTYQLPANMRRLLSKEDNAETVADADGVPSWVGDAGRRLLSATPATVTPNVVVAQDGSGKYKTINAALAEVPKNGNSTFVIYVKAGVYAENVNITRSMDNVFLIGDGPTKTKITGSRSYIGGYNTYKTATVCKSPTSHKGKIEAENSCAEKKITADVAATFTPSKFIDGNTWIPATGVPYVPDMIQV
ncbi:hypothetical protein RHGRI_012593 [Rhododendron griersonianum]|uniref:Pectinesterase inhibitor domain-containing protein n=1 Tax=Rhododendron griersonianum TaxID=479676 RepID=A0AAV6KSL0_9ERIC|nr:hypothetical protein RHGRI_012593 [Rhododendron griersonianum]